MKRFIGCLSLWFWAGLAGAAVIRIPADQSTIQAGIDAADFGDTVLVAPGTYWVNLDFKGKTITLTSEAGPHLTILRPDSARIPMVTMVSGETPSTVLSGFKLSHTTGSWYGSAVRIEGSSPTISGNHFTDHTNYPGGAPVLYVRDGSQPLIEDNLFYDNEGADRIVWIDTDLPAWLINNTIYGGVNATLIFAAQCVVRNNIITNCDRGLYAYYGCVEDHNCIWGNVVDYDHVGPDTSDISTDPLFVDAADDNFYLQPSSPCSDAGNPDPDYDDPDGSVADIGACYFDNRAPRATSLNLGDEDVGHVLSHTPTIYWTYFDTIGTQTMYEIEVGTDDDWAVAEMWSSGQVASTDTSAVYSGTELQDSTTYFYRVRVRNVDVWGIWGGSVFRMSSLPFTPQPIWPLDDALVSRYGVQLITTNSFDPEGDILTYDFEIWADSEMFIDSVTGVPEGEGQTNSGIFAPVLAGWWYQWRCRSFDGFEHSQWSPWGTFVSREPIVIGVPTDQPTVQAAIDSAQERDTVVIEDGVYSGEGNRDLDFGGTNIVVMCQNGRSQTIIDCGGSAADPHMAFIFAKAEDSTSIIEGITIRGAFVDTSLYGNGGAVHCSEASPTINDCVIEDNTANGVWCMNASPRISNCMISTNSEDGVRAYGWSSDVYMEGCLVMGNGRHGLLTEEGKIIIRHCTFVGNGQSGIFFLGWPPKQRELPERADVPVVYACIAAHNGYRGFEQLFYYPDLVISCSDAWGNPEGNWLTYVAQPGDSAGNIEADPQFCDTAADDYRVALTSPCATANNDCHTTMGALDEGCGLCCVGLRGNVDGDAEDLVNIVDLTYLVAYLFAQGPEPPCQPEANVDGDPGGTVNIVDVTYLVAYLFGGGQAPAECPE